jgi:hypothetical protein
LPSARDIEFLSVDLRDVEAARAAFEPLRSRKCPCRKSNSSILMV